MILLLHTYFNLQLLEPSTVAAGEELNDVEELSSQDLDELVYGATEDQIQALMSSSEDEEEGEELNDVEELSPQDLDELVYGASPAEVEMSDEQIQALMSSIEEEHERAQVLKRLQEEQDLVSLKKKLFLLVSGMCIEHLR